SINRSLEWMITNNLLKKRNNDDLDNSEYGKPWATDELRMLCPEILKYDITVISVLVKGMADAETEIRNSEDVSGIISLLKSLQYGQEVNVDTLHRDSLTKLNQLGVISISLNNHIAISELGKRILSKLLHD
ncbi:MAG: hypothetical protein WBZ36_26550, partial [Candidatus Nitrosopolaris sp.]